MLVVAGCGGRGAGGGMFAEGLVGVGVHAVHVDGGRVVVHVVCWVSVGAGVTSCLLS